MNIADEAAAAVVARLKARGVNAAVAEGFAPVSNVACRVDADTPETRAARVWAPIADVLAPSGPTRIRAEAWAAGFVIVYAA
jgi:hypothetical protein